MKVAETVKIAETCDVPIAESWASSALRHASAYFWLCKPRVLIMVLAATLAGLYLGAASSPGALALGLTIKLLVGVAIAAAGTLALNQYIERDIDAKMERTKGRPLPSGQVTPLEALVFGTGCALSGTAFLWLTVNGLSALVVASITLLYLFGYTPMKRQTWWCDLLGAVPGALPPVAGWAAAHGSLAAPAWVLFGIMYFWQLPHALAVGELYQEDYACAGIKVLPRGTHGINLVNRMVVIDCAALAAVGALPTLMGFAGLTYLLAAGALGFAMLYFGYRVARAPYTAREARRLLMASLVYLPTLLLALVLDRR